MYRNFKSQLGYENGENKIDSYGVDHSNFSLRDEISYQMARTNRENELIKNYNNQGITQDYPQYNTNFWGGNPANNYGFGSSNISDNIENVTNSLKNQNYGLYQNSGTIAPVPQTNQQQNTAFGQSNNILTQNNNTSLNQTPTPWNTEANKMQNQTTFSWNRPKTTCTISEYDIKTPVPTLNNVSHHQTTNENNKAAIFNRVINKSLEEEGGYEDRNNRIDTPTNMGIQQSSLERFKIAHPELAEQYPDNIKDITRDQVRQIARLDYFDKYRIGEIIAPTLQEIMFDSFFNHSPTAPAQWAQRAINQQTNMQVDEDGIFGSQTIRALNNLTPEEIIRINNAIVDFRKADFEHQIETNSNSNYKEYSHGLPNRFERFRIK